MELSDLKKDYGVLAKKYKLPNFEELNEKFEIEKIDSESDCLLRVVRKTMMDKIVNLIGFIEMVLNPVNAPRFYLYSIKSMSNESKKTMDELYFELGKLSLEALRREIDYSEKDEAELIKNISSTWDKVKPDFKSALQEFLSPKDNETKKERSYFG